MAERKSTQRSTKHTHKTKDQVTRTPLKTGGELWCSGRVSRSCSTNGTRRGNLVTKPVISHEWGKDCEVFTSGYNWNIVEKVSLNTLLTNCESHHVIFFSEDSSPVRGTKRKLEEGEEEEEDDWDIDVNWLCWQFLTKGTELLVSKGSYFCFREK